MGLIILCFAFGLAYSFAAAGVLEALGIKTECGLCSKDAVCHWCLTDPGSPKYDPSTATSSRSALSGRAKAP